MWSMYVDFEVSLTSFKLILYYNFKGCIFEYGVPNYKPNNQYLYFLMFYQQCKMFVTA